MPRGRKRSRSRSRSKSSSSSSRSRRSRKKADKKRSRSQRNRHSDRRRSRSRSRRANQKKSRDRSSGKRGGKQNQSKDADAKRPESKEKNVVAKKTKGPVRALANALTVLKKGAEKERLEQQVPQAKWQTKVPQRPHTGKDDDARSSLKCAHPDCEFKVHADPSVSESFCCGYCEFCFFSEPRCEHSHGKKCESIVAGKDAERAKPPANGKPVTWGHQWGTDKSDRKGGKGKGKGKGKREEKGDPLAQDYSRTNAKVGREGASKSKALRAWSDEEDAEAKPEDAKIASMDDSGPVASTDDSGLVACAHPLCTLAKHSDSFVSEKFCCKACAACFEEDSSCAPWNHGKKCEHISMPFNK